MKTTIAITLLIFSALLLVGCINTGDKMTNFVVLETNKGNIKLELNPEKAPITVKNFQQYVSEGFYDGTVFHRVIKGFMIQTGGMTADGTEKDTHKPIKLESNNGLRNLKGTIAMARTNVPNSATSQFFINTVDNAFLDYNPGNDGYAVFGEVIEGMEVVKEIEKVRTSRNGYHDDWPTENIVIEKAYFVDN